METIDALREDRASGGYLFRKPTAVDGRPVWELIADCPPLDTNSLYCNLLQCTHFADTCVVAEEEERVHGWISGYRLPTEPQTLFIWQVAVHPDARKCGLARSLIRVLLARNAASGVRQLKATVTSDNQASWALFRSIADSLRVPMTSEEYFRRKAHFGGRHETEHMLTIGPWIALDATECGPGSSSIA
ncbi:diaminobutyrate acetyltransferase [Bradyrhizobium cenepequi]|uniref:diaminobutyrate acetyltransferase n=1 Tax=Bradyrhizobium cenepequi TaxID=2821403 RepID=UPI001CE31E1C|nr:diaminobutyrate acetyltransferase [Bradyrhizobium cenepequi]MCA6107055.1 diaminobutyrate acetyltransferase [Bradyrhizobium cenepequi]